ncbi:ATP-binding protein [Rhodococcus coprophilus]|uniref:histidine kinase n=1 Tax=Rhodococcus coprophilus TaxID=38310 RepID=A0A2X4XCQ6_9NOCA|nr:ATP-binding protein [Rhodococcus coprophilus]MBM7458950.1 signal transduction histidine kinase [Rhodococcus coprophilus]SQI34374.1 sensor kinase [Rhodococcus coprophilus]
MSLKQQFRQYSPENWRLWRKVTAIVAVPIIAAAFFGSLRVYTLFEDSRHFATAAEQVSILPMFAEYSTGVAGAAAATIIGLPTDNGETTSREAERVLTEQMANISLEPEIKSALNKVLAEGNSLLDSAVAGSMAPLVASERAQAFISRVSSVFRAAASTAPEPDVLQESATLLDMWTTQWALLDQVVAFSALGDGTEGSLLMWSNALGTDAAQVSILRETVEANPSITDTSSLDALTAELDNRRTLTAGLDSGSGDTAALRNSIFTSLMVYIEEVRNSSIRIVGLLDQHASEARTEALKNAIGIAVVLAVALGLTVMVALSIVRPLRRLRNDTLLAAEQSLPEAIAAIKDGAEIDSVTLPPVRVHSKEEVGEVARAVDTMNEGALRLAGEQAQLRRQVNEMLETLARRNKTLVEQQLSLIDSLEHEERDPTRLQNLFALDHLAARMRRTGDSLLVLAGTRQRMGRIPDTPLGDVLRAAVSQVENYQRVNVGNAPEGSLVGTAVTDVVHMVAELLDNALRASPPESTVAFAFSRAVDGGLLLEIADRGIGIPGDELAEINERLATDSEAGSGAARRMGLFVVARLAARHGITVRLRPTFDSATNSGVTASLYLPIRLLKGTGSQSDPFQIDRPRRLPTPAGETSSEYTDQYDQTRSYSQNAVESYAGGSQNGNEAFASAGQNGGDASANGSDSYGSYEQSNNGYDQNGNDSYNNGYDRNSNDSYAGYEQNSNDSYNNGYDQNGDDSYGSFEQNNNGYDQNGNDSYNNGYDRNGNDSYNNGAPAENPWERPLPPSNPPGPAPGTSPGIRRGQLHERWVSRNNGE